MSPLFRKVPIFLPAEPRRDRYPFRITRELIPFNRGATGLRSRQRPHTRKENNQRVTRDNDSRQSPITAYVIGAQPLDARSDPVETQVGLIQESKIPSPGSFLESASTSPVGAISRRSSVGLDWLIVREGEGGSRFRAELVFRSFLDRFDLIDLGEDLSV